MGLLQLLRDDVYQELCRRSIEFTRGRGEVMIGAGDASLARTLARVEFLNTLRGVDAVVVLAPYFMQFSQPELIDYYRAIADASRVPVYLYDLPQRTRSKIETRTVLELLRHPQSKGIKCSDEIAATRQLIGEVGGQGRVIVAQPLLVDVLLREGIREHLDGVFSLVPKWTVAIGRAADADDWHRARLYQERLVAVLSMLVKYGVFPASTAILNACGVEGRVGPRPYRMLDRPTVDRLLAEPIVVELLRGADVDDASGASMEPVSEGGRR
jgi:4-hydroxy-tetrahydrodipicolinate synthase